MRDDDGGDCVGDGGNTRRPRHREVQHAADGERAGGNPGEPPPTNRQTASAAKRSAEPDENREQHHLVGKWDGRKHGRDGGCTDVRREHEPGTLHGRTRCNPCSARSMADIQRPNTAQRLHQDIDYVVRKLDPTIAEQTDPIERTLKRHGRRTWHLMKRHPFVGATALAALGLGAAMTVGAAELMFAVGLAVAAYKVMREGEPPLEAMTEAQKLVTP